MTDESGTITAAAGIIDSAEALLVCATETRTDADIATYTDHLNRIFASRTTAGCPVKPKMA